MITFTTLFPRHCIHGRCVLLLYLASVILCSTAMRSSATNTDRRMPVSLTAGDVLQTGNEWISLPAIRASDGALESFNVLSMRDRGLLAVTGSQGSPALTPYFMVGTKPLIPKVLKWDLIEYWIPVGSQIQDGIEVTVTYCAPPGSRAAVVRLTMTNHRAEAVPVTMGMRASWGNLSRITYTPVTLIGDRTMGPAAWAKDTQVFSFITHDTNFAWSLSARGSQTKLLAPPVSLAPGLDAQRALTLAPGETAEAHYVVGVGIEEYSASQSGEALEDTIDRSGLESVLNQSAAWCRKHTRTTGQGDLDMLMNRNFLFTALYAWGRTLDTEQLVGVTSRSPRYYVSAAYWDRDAMLWSLPGLLDIDPAMAREALEYALGTQLRNTGTHSRFIDGIVLEDGFELDEGVAPIIAVGQYVRRTGDDSFLSSHSASLATLRANLQNHFDNHNGLYATLQDAQDQYYKQQFSIYDNVLVWKALREMAWFAERMKDAALSRDMLAKSDALHKAIMKYGISDSAAGSPGPIFACATDGKTPLFAEVPPGSLLKLPPLGFVAEDDPLFVRTYNWLHSDNYKYSHSNSPYGLPGSYRLPFTTAWSIADHMLLKRGQQQALKILRASSWDGGIITEGVDPETAVMDNDGRAFATAAGYVAHAICQSFCTDSPH